MVDVAMVTPETREWAETRRAAMLEELVTLVYTVASKDSKVRVDGMRARAKRERDKYLAKPKGNEIP